MDTAVVIIGAGQAGLTAAVSLRESGWTGSITLIGNEERGPYQRPPLSKGYLSGAEGEDVLTLRSVEALERMGIGMRFGVDAVGLDRTRRVVSLSDGSEAAYDHLVFATGSSCRELRVPGRDLDGVHAIRTVGDADALREDFARGGSTVFIGGGFLNLEVAVEARRHGEVTVAEVGSQILRRVVSAETAAVLTEHHRDRGIEIRCNAEVSAVRGSAGRVDGVELVSGEVIPADRVVVSIGSVPCTGLAEAAGLRVEGGILVDGSLRTADERIFAIGDCAAHPNPYAGATTRVESVQNATDQGRHLAAVLTGADAPYAAVPWFWSTQGEAKLQIAGIAARGDESRVVESTDAGRLVVERYRGDRLVAVETINAPGPHMKARKVLASALSSV